MSNRGVSEIETRYFEWLYRHAGSLNDRNPSHTHWMLAEQMHRKVFQVYVPYDENRAGDGLNLRTQFCDEEMPNVDPKVFKGDCSMFEMLVAFAHRVEYETIESDIEKGAEAWFWQLLKNCDLARFTDDVYLDNPDAAAQEVDYILDRVIERRYRRDGHGGLFPLQNPREDQRRVELWYQMQAYVIQKSDILD